MGNTPTDPGSPLKGEIKIMVYYPINPGSLLRDPKVGEELLNLPDFGAGVKVPEGVELVVIPEDAEVVIFKYNSHITSRSTIAWLLKRWPTMVAGTKLEGVKALALEGEIEIVVLKREEGEADAEGD